MKLTKFETYGIGFSIAAMVAALWVVRVEMTNDALVAETVGDTEEASVFVADADNQRAAIADALLAASNDAGTLEKVIIDDVVLGEGEPVEVGDVVSVHYIGTLQNGQQFDNSYLRGAPFSFEVGSSRVIAGWNEGLVGMRVGGQRVIVIPPTLAYGSSGYGPIPPNATLVFALELVAINE